MIYNSTKTNYYSFEDETKGFLCFEYIPCINYSLYHNNIPICIKFSVSNQDDNEWNNVQIAIKGDFFESTNTIVESIPAQQEIAIKDIEISPIANKLIELTEAVNSHLSVTILQDEKVILQKEFPVYLMAFDQWFGTSIRPEVLASFVTPNHPLLTQVISNAASHLKRFSGSDAFDEYQTQNPNRVRMQVAAIFEALREENLIYTSAPASYEDYGQRIRMCDKVLNEKLGTCIDLTLLFASCLESVGIHPLLVLMNGHIFVGAWLVDSVFSSAVSDDVSFLRKESSDGINEMVFVESTCIASSSAISFEDAVDNAAKSLWDETNFNMFIDICRARMERIRPLPQLSKKDGHWEIINGGSTHELGTQKVHEYQHYDIKIEENETEITKQIIWERKLLDFTLRNNLLNMKIGKRVIPFISFSIDKLEDYIQAGEHYQLLPNTYEKKLEIDQNTGIYNSSAYKSELEDFILKDLSEKKLHSYLGENELTDAIKHLYRESRTAMEENGANTLFLVLGVLKWYESPQSERPRFAPLLLLPVEIVRNGGCKKYILRARDEEVILNITLVELLKQKYELLLPGLTPLPKDHSGVDVKKIFTIIRTCILKEKGWDVLEECMLGLFSFNKFVMWNDIHSNADLLKENDIIRSLMENRIVNNIDFSEIDIHKIDNDISPLEYALPVSADSSQMKAVLEAGKGKSFILHGPPGTGKSQTITNIIANALYHGKRVLFVAEKMAALSVVQSRLARIGLEPFCLELHSNKANKKHFLEQIDSVLNIKRLSSSSEFTQEAERLFEKRKELVTYMSTLHKVQACGLSLFDCINHYLAISEDELQMPFDDIENLNKETIQKYVEAVEKLDTIVEITGRPETHPLNGLYPKTYSLETKEALTDLLPRYEDGIKSFHSVSLCIQELLDIDLTITPDNINTVLDLLNCLQHLPMMNRGIIDYLSEDSNQEHLSHVLSLAESCEKQKANILKEYSPEILDQDAELLKRDWNEIQNKWFIPKFFASKKFVERLSCFSAQIRKGDVDSILERLSIYQKERKELTEEHLENIFGEIAKTGRENWTTIAVIVNEIPHLIQLLNRISGIKETSLIQLIEALLAKVNNHWSLYKQSNTHSWNALSQKLKDFIETGYELEKIAHIDTESSNDYPTTNKVKQWINNLDLLKDWQHWCTQKEYLEKNGIRFIIKEYEKNEKTAKQLSQQMVKRFYHLLSTQIIEKNTYLDQFNGILFEKQIEKYQLMVKHFQELTLREIYCKLASNIPTINMEASASSEIGILKKNIKNGGRGNSIRKIMDQTPNLLPKLCPCMLMSPISVAQYIDLSQEKFDLVIFDEASQMPTSEAVGAISRGKSLIVVGDPKQMPPTSFFSSNKQEEDDDAYLDDLDSILDDCIALSLPSHYLAWHYRSKHESLIAFSNSQYYNNKLYTFPSIDDRDIKVKLVHIDGIYDKGRTRSNKSEAEAIVKEVIHRLSDDELSTKSIGIVAFSSAQQNLIEDLLTDALAQNPELEKRAFQCEEPIFVKNLENVQGDERDVILFSIGYGPDKNGHVSMNFGPLNNNGGERRLNVAVSRARYEMIVFSTLKYEQIDLKRTHALGVEGLKNFLCFAENGTLIQSSIMQKKQDTSAIVNDIAKTLQEEGYIVDTKVGRSNFKVDVAVVSPEDSNKYILGILCDRKDLYERHTIRDRQIVQPSVLKLLNWNVLHVWSVDWLVRKQAVLDKIHKQIQQCALAPAAPQNSTETEEQIINFKDELKNLQPEVIVNKQEMDYTFATLEPCSQASSVDEVLDNSNKIKKQIKNIIETEQPITNTLVYKRIVQLWKLTRNTPRIQSMIDDMLAPYYVDPYSLNSTKTYWKTGDDCQRFKGYRVHSNRDVLDIPLIETMNAMVYVIEQQVSIPKEECKRVTSQVLGFSHMGSNIDLTMETALSILLERGILQIQNDRVTKKEH